MLHTEDECFELWVPGLGTLSKSTGEDGDERGYFDGIAAIESEDIQQDILIQDGMDWSYFLMKGFFNFDHQDKVKGVSEVVGEPLSVERVEVGGVPATLVKGYLYLSQPRGCEIWTLAKAIKKAGGRRGLGMSVQGAVLERVGNVIKRCEVKHIAITHQPQHLSTSLTLKESIAKSQAVTSGVIQPSSGGGSLGPLIRQSLARRGAQKNQKRNGNPFFLNSYNLPTFAS